MTTISSSEPSSRSPAEEAAANRRFRYMWGALATSAMGTAVTTVALPLAAVTVVEASPLQVGLIASATYAAWICIGLPAGVIVQRLPLRGTQVTMDLLRGAALASMPIAWWLGELYWWHLLLVALVISFCSVLFDVGNATFMTSVVPKDELQRRNSLISGTESTAQLAGPSLGGFLVQLIGAVPTLLVDAISYLCSALFLRALPRVPVSKPDAWPPVASMIAEGWHYVVRHPVIGSTMVTAAILNFVAGVQLALFPLYLVRELDTPAALVGVLYAGEGAGALTERP